MRGHRQLVLLGSLCLLAEAVAASQRGGESLLLDGFEDGTACLWSSLSPAEPPLISEIVVQPSEAEFVEIYNPAPPAVDLSDYYLADYPLYYGLTTAGDPPVDSDFRARFPAETSLGCGDVVVVSLESGTAFFTVYGTAPDFDFAPGDPTAPDMIGELSSVASLTNSDEMVVLFRWDGASDLVADADYLLYGDASDAMDKTAIEVGESSYQPETAAASQAFVPEPALGVSLHRCDFAETTEAKSGGNGIGGHDETSESFTSSFAAGTPSPGAPTGSACF